MIGRRLHELRADGLSLGYAGPDVVTNLDVVVPDGRITMVVGANACGKSTLLRGLARLLRPRNGAVLLDGVSLDDMRSVDVARTLGLLPQTPVAPDGITVGDLVGRGRYPHQGWFRRWSTRDAGAVAEALDATGIADLVDRGIDELSGGQRQRVWVAMALAQDTDLLLLDEPTTFLDISHQVDLLDLLTDLNRNAGKTVVIVLHDLNLACRYGDHLIAMKNGTILAQGAPRDVVTAALVADVFGLACEIVPDPVSGTPMVVPRGRHHPGPGRLAAVPTSRRTESLVLEEGTPAPDFSLVSDSGETVSLSDFRGRPVVLYFYPKDDTPGCTKQACGLRDSYAGYEERGAVILGVSPDGEDSHASFKAKYGLPFTLLADPDRSVARAYDVWREKTSYGKKSMGIVRSTFVIDGDGTVVRALYGVKPDGHAEKVLNVLP